MAFDLHPQVIFLLSDSITGSGAYEVDQRPARALEDLNPVLDSATGRRAVQVNCIQFLAEDEDRLGTLRTIAERHGGEGGYKVYDRAAMGVGRMKPLAFILTLVIGTTGLADAVHVVGTTAPLPGSDILAIEGGRVVYVDLTGARRERGVEDIIRLSDAAFALDVAEARLAGTVDDEGLRLLLLARLDAPDALSRRWMHRRLIAVHDPARVPAGGVPLRPVADRGSARRMASGRAPRARHADHAGRGGRGPAAGPHRPGPGATETCVRRSTAWRTGCGPWNGHRPRGPCRDSIPP